MPLFRWIFLVVLAAAILVPAKGASGAATRSCPSFAAPHPDRPNYRAENVVATGISCDKARVKVRFFIRNHPVNPNGWKCRTAPYSCTYDSKKRITFTILDRP